MCCFEPKLVKVHMCILTFQVSVSAVAEAHYLRLLQACLSGMASSSLSCVKTCCSFASSFFLPAAAPMCCISTLISTIWLPVEICSWPSRSSIRLKRAQSWVILLDLSISVSNREVWSGVGAVGLTVFVATMMPPSCCFYLCKLLAMFTRAVDLWLTVGGEQHTFWAVVLLVKCVFPLPARSWDSLQSLVLFTADGLASWTGQFFHSTGHFN